MAVYLWSTLTGSIAVFNPGVDVIRFDDTTISAAAVGLTDGGTSVFFSYDGKTIEVAMSLRSITTSNVRFDNNSVLRVGDNSTGVAGDDLSQVPIAPLLPVGTLRNDQLLGLGGDDYIEGYAGSDVLRGGDGNDKLEGGAGADVIDGGNGFDFATYIQGALSVTIGVTADLLMPALNAGHAAGDTYVSIEGLIGSGSVDELSGDDARNYLIGGSGSDTLRGRGGNDVLEGGDGADVFVGGPGADQLIGGADLDLAVVDVSVDGIVINMSNPAESTGEAAGDTFTGVDNLQGTNGNDVLTGDSFHNDLHGLAGDDLLFGLDGNDFLFGGDGHDVLDGGALKDGFDGGSGIDTVSYIRATSGVTANLLTQTPGSVGATDFWYVSVERLMGSDFNDSLTGDLAPNTLEGGEGNDYLEGLGGDDILAGGGGDDQLSGGAGADVLVGLSGVNTARYLTSPAGLTVDLGTPFSNTGDAAGDQFAWIQCVFGSYFGDTLRGDHAGNGLIGLDGSDTILGRSGDDVLQGGNGNDTLDGGAGFDRYHGGDGDDTFVLTRGEVLSDAIFDFAGNGSLPGGDLLEFHGYGTVGASVTPVPGFSTRWQVHSADGLAHDTFVLLNAAAIGPGDFVFV